MRLSFRKRLPATVLAIALAATGTAVGGTAYVAATGSRPGPGTDRVATPPMRGPDGPVREIVPATDPPAALKRVVPPDFLVVGTGSVSAGRLAAAGRLPYVRDLITVDGGAVRLQGGQVNMFAVDAGRFRSWTPPGTAKNDRLWAALAQNRFVVSDEVRRRFGLRQDLPYALFGRAGLTVPMGGAGALGLPGINVLVGRKIGRSLGLVSDVAFLVNAPGADRRALAEGLRALAGAGSQVIDLRRREAPSPGGAPAGRPATYLALYQQAATSCPGLSWTVLAAIGQVESDHGRNTGPSSAGALGPMQFMPATWRTYGVDGDGDGKADIMDPYDAVPAAARYLCAGGAGRGAAGLARAVFAYNHAQAYVDGVLTLARAYARQYS